MKIVEIEWYDSGGAEPIWCSKTDFPEEPGECKSIGYLVKETKKTWVICQSDGDLQIGHVFVIPKINVIKMDIIRDE